MAPLMDSVGSRELKNKTGEILRRVRRGERVTVTRRGKPIALLVPIADAEQLDDDGIRPFDEAWPDILDTLSRTPPAHESWRDAMAASRKRP